jgi:hypothetical protein
MHNLNIGHQTKYRDIALHCFSKMENSNDVIAIDINAIEHAQ